MTTDELAPAAVSAVIGDTLQLLTTSVVLLVSRIGEATEKGYTSLRCFPLVLFSTHPTGQDKVGRRRMSISVHRRTDHLSLALRVCTLLLPPHGMVRCCHHQAEQWQASIRITDGGPFSNKPLLRASLTLQVGLRRRKRNEQHACVQVVNHSTLFTCANIELRSHYCNRILPKAIVPFLRVFQSRSLTYPVPVSIVTNFFRAITPITDDELMIQLQVEERANPPTHN
jgi:hypothetical protein